MGGFLFPGIFGAFLASLSLLALSVFVRTSMGAATSLACCWASSACWTISSVDYVFTEGLVYKIGVLSALFMASFIIGFFSSTLVPWWRFSRQYAVLGGGFWLLLCDVCREMIGLPWMTFIDVFAAMDIVWAQGCAYVGKNFLNLIAVLVLGSLWLYRNSRKRLIWVLCLVGLIYSLGFWRLKAPMSCFDMHVSLIHTEYALHPYGVENDLRFSCLLPKKEKGAHVVIFPESFFCAGVARYPKCVEAINSVGYTHIFGGGVSRQKEEVRNSLLEYKTQAKHFVACYDKVHLVPLGEYLPFANVFKFWGSGLAQDGCDFQPGTEFDVVSCGCSGQCSMPSFYPMVCYDGVFPVLNKNARWLVNISNELWFCGTPEARLHWLLFRVRCVESGLGGVRATNCGVSGCIDPCGRVLKQHEGVSECVHVRVPKLTSGCGSFWLYHHKFFLYLFYFVIIVIIIMIRLRLFCGGPNVLGAKKNT